MNSDWQKLSRRLLRWSALTLLASTLSVSIACKRGGISLHEVMYVSAPQTVLRDRVSAVFNKVGTVKNGDRVEVLEKQKRFVRVRAAGGVEGWVELRSLVSDDTYKAFEKMAVDSKQSPVQGHGVTRAQLNMHVQPGRETETLYQLADGEKVEILRRSTTERATPEQIAASRAAAIAKATGESTKPKPATHPPNRSTEKQLPPSPTPKPGETTAAAGKAPATTAPSTGKPGSTPAPPEEEKPKLYDDWWLVRNQQGHVGWVLARMIDLDVPLEVAQYAEGQRIQGAYVLNTVQDEDKTVSQYVLVLNEPKDGLPYDFNQVRVFTWNLKKHRYETSYRERNIMGYFPVTVGSENFGPDGVNPTFTVREKGEDGNLSEHKYRLIGPITKRVLAPGEQPVKPAVVQKTKKLPVKPNQHKKHR